MINKSMSGISNINCNGNINSNTIEYSSGLYFTGLSGNIQARLNALNINTNTIIYWRKSTVVEIQTMTDSLPAEYVKIEKTPMKAEIKEALKCGEKIDGCFLVEKQNVQIK